MQQVGQKWYLSDVWQLEVVWALAMAAQTRHFTELS